MTEQIDNSRKAPRPAVVTSKDEIICPACGSDRFGHCYWQEFYASGHLDRDTLKNPPAREFEDKEITDGKPGGPLICDNCQQPIDEEAEPTEGK